MEMTVQPILRTAWRLGIVLGAALTLAGCSNRDGGEASTLRQVYDGARSIVSGDADAAARSGVTLSDAQLNAAPLNILLLTIPKIGSDVGLVPQAVNRDTITWISSDSYTVATRRGQIVGTVGFSADLNSADVPDIRGGADRVIRDHYRLTEDESIQRTRYFCDLARAPGQRIIVTGRAFTTTRVDETCLPENGPAIQNTYWIDGRGVIRQSRQFVSPFLGYFELQDVHTGLR